jgi:hypothetical protein
VKKISDVTSAMDEGAGEARGEKRDFNYFKKILKYEGSTHF